MTIFVNEQQHSFTDRSLSVADLLRRLNIPEAGTAVAREGRLIKRGDWEETPLADADRITLISAAYGG